MANFSRTSYENAARAFLANNADLTTKYLRPDLLELVINVMLSSLPTSTAARIAFDQLVVSGQLQRTDGKTDRDDMVQAVKAAEANLAREVARVDAPPLTREESEFFGSLSQQDLAKRYWESDGVNEFAVRYRKAVKEQGFRIPPKPALQLAVGAQAIQGDEPELSLEAYHALSAHDMKAKLRDPKFRLQVMLLMKKYGSSV